MNHLSASNIVGSTVKFPLNFFFQTNFVDLLNDFHDNFYPSNDEFSIWNSLPWSNVNLSNESFSYDYEEEISFDEFSGPVNNWRTVVVFFEIEFKRFLKEKVNDSLYLLNEHVLSSKFKHSVKAYLENQIEILVSLPTQNITKFGITKYNKIINAALHEIITQIYLQFPSYNLKISHEVKEFLLSQNLETYNIEVRSLKIGIAGKIVSLKKETGKEFFNFISTESVETTFKNFILNQFEKIDTQIDFLNNIEAAYYLIYKLSVCLGYSAPAILDCQAFTFRKRPFSINSYHKHIHKYNASDSKFKKLIDSLIEDNLI